MSAETFNPNPDASSNIDPSATAEQVTSVDDQTVNEILDLYEAKQPANVAEAIDLAADGQKITQSVQEHMDQGVQLDATTTARLKAATGQGVDRWIVNKDAAQKLAQQAEGGKPDEISTRDWYNMGGLERKPYREAAAQKLQVSDGLKQYKREQAAQAKAAAEQARIEAEKAQAAAEAEARRVKAEGHAAKAEEYRSRREQLLADKLEAEKQRVTDATYDAKRAELEAQVADRIQQIHDKNPHLSPTARAVMEAGARDQLARDIENESVAAADQAAAEREALINANGGAATIDTIRNHEERIAFLKRLHGDKYDQLFDENGNNRKEMARNKAAEAATETTPNAEETVDTSTESGASTSSAANDGTGAEGAPQAVRTPLDVIEGEVVEGPIRKPLDILGDETMEIPVIDAEQEKWNRVADELGDLAVKTVVKKPGIFARLKARRAQSQAAKAAQPKSDKPVRPSKSSNKHKWEPRTAAQMFALTGANQLSRETRDQLLTEELQSQGIHGEAEIAAAKTEIEQREQAIADHHNQKVLAEAEQATKDKKSLKERAKDIQAKAGSKLRRTRRPQPQARTSEEIAALMSMMRDNDENK